MYRESNAHRLFIFLKGRYALPASPLLLLPLILLFLLSGCTTGSDPDDTFRWENLGLPVESGYELFLEDGRLYVAAGHDGLYVLDTSGPETGWDHLGQSVPDDQQKYSYGVREIFAYGDTLYIHTAVQNEEGRYVGIWRSVDGGAGWQEADEGMVNANGQTFIGLDLTVSPHDPELMIAGGGNVYRSENGGDRWTHVYPDEYKRIYPPGFNLTWHPAEENTVWAYGQTGFYAPYMRVSQDAGKNWTTFNLPVMSFENSFYSMAFDAVDPEVVYVGAQGGVIRSMEGGNEWISKQEASVLFEDDGGRFFRALETHPTREGVLFAGAVSRLYGSADYGETQHLIETPPELEYILDMWYEKETEHLYIAGIGGVYRLVNPMVALVESVSEEE